MTEDLLKSISEKLENAPDCGDNSCWYTSKRGGMRTNGGCRCSDERSILKRTPIERWAMGTASILRKVYDENLELRAAIHQMLVESTTINGFDEDDVTTIKLVQNLGQEALKMKKELLFCDKEVHIFIGKQKTCQCRKTKL